MCFTFTACGNNSVESNLDSSAPISSEETQDTENENTESENSSSEESDLTSSDETSSEEEEETHSHTFTSATCTKPRTCTECGEIQGDKATHKFNDGSCSVCGSKDSSYCNLLDWQWVSASKTKESNRYVFNAFSFKTKTFATGHASNLLDIKDQTLVNSTIETYPESVYKYKHMYLYNDDELLTDIVYTTSGNRVTITLKYQILSRARTIETPESSTNIESTEISSDNTSSTESSTNSEETSSVVSSDTTVSTDSTETSSNVESSDKTESVEDSDKTESVEDSNNTESVEDSDKTESVEDSDKTESTETSSNVESSDKTESVEDSDKTESTETSSNVTSSNETESSDEDDEEEVDESEILANKYNNKKIVIERSGNKTYTVISSEIDNLSSGDILVASKKYAE